MSDSVHAADPRSTPSRSQGKESGPLRRLLDALTRPFQKTPKKSKKKGNPNIYPLY